MLPILRLAPRLVPRPWGGARLSTLLGKKCSPAEKIGESWELSDRPDTPSAIEGGPHHGRRFGDLIREFPKEMIGRSQPPPRFPLLVKYIDAAEDLSIQVHPDDEYAERKGLGDRGKTECWYILDCHANGEIIFGLREGVGPHDLERAIREGAVDAAVRRAPISPGDFLFVPAGTVHAILAGTLLCEIQQSSDLTFRLWDWNRVPARPLHIRESLEVARYQPTAIPVIATRSDNSAGMLLDLTRNRFFQVRLASLPPRSRLTVTQPGHGLILNGVLGSCSVNGLDLSLGGTLFIPACVSEIEIEAGEKGAAVLLTESLEV